MNKRKILFFIITIFFVIYKKNYFYSQIFEEKLNLRGNVTSLKNNTPITSANIWIKNTYYGTTTDEKGYFELTFPKKFKNDTLIISCVGYKTEMFHLDTLNLNEPLYVELEDSLFILSEIDVIAYDYIDFLRWKAKNSETSQLYMTFATRDIQNVANFINFLKENIGRNYKLKANSIRWKKVFLNDKLPQKVEVFVSWFRCPYCPLPEDITVIIDVIENESLCENIIYQPILKEYFQSILDKTFATGVDINQLIIIESIAYLKGDTVPYTGYCYGYFENGQKGVRGYYENGLKNKYWEYWYSNGQKKIEGTYKNGKKEGIWKYYYPNGKLRILANYKNDLMDGINIWFYENGNKKKEVLFREGVYLDKTEWDEKGKVIETKSFQ